MPVSPTFPADELAARLDRVRHSMAAANLDGQLALVARAMERVTPGRGTYHLGAGTYSATAMPCSLKSVLLTASTPPRLCGARTGAGLRGCRAVDCGHAGHCPSHQAECDGRRGLCRLGAGRPRCPKTIDPETIEPAEYRQLSGALRSAAPIPIPLLGFSVARCRLRQTETTHRPES